MGRIFWGILGMMFFLPGYGQQVLSLTLDGAINPATAQYVHRGIEKAVQMRAEAVLIHLNTPGGLLESTRQIVGDMLDASVPVIVYVAPAGAHAGSAGVFVTMAAHLAAMAPGTNLGAAHPVSMGEQVDSVMNEKITNDAAAFIRTIAEKRHRNFTWAEQAVRNSVSITETEALREHVIDLIADRDADLLQKADGRRVALAAGDTVTLHTAHATLEPLPMTTTEKILALISDPNVAYVLLLLGMFGILFELYNPGGVLPGIIGVICLIVAFYAMNALPVNYAGVGLIIFSVILFLLEIKIASHGALALGGIISLLLGSMMLIKPDSSFDVVRLSGSVILFSVLLTALFFFVVIGIGLKAQQLKPVTGIQGMVGERGVAITSLNPAGAVRVHGERWNAIAEGSPIAEGEIIEVVRVDNLTLYVKSVASSS
ncbi:membrane-bound serine protease (ClpP class) [Thermoflavifilum aggregans]|uniref:Membrane-bound serine protease (ClpP class) n=1 Tax=Thermoflavifilum aggregans TaxID=454188 RepID=A0A2M9CUE1_9BACT|nr:nodulation protein NfeD [Thermoflavifilum aggregans]PJJ75511.1 membrane-bound serine protease (ClpP class) [Thermoflavifilum aggregans]